MVAVEGVLVFISDMEGGRAENGTMSLLVEGLEEGAETEMEGLTNN